MKSMRRFAAALAALALVAAPAIAQQTQKPAGPQVMKTFGGWDVRCYAASTVAPCDIWEAVAFKTGGQLAVSVSAVYVPSQDRYVMQFIVPLGVDFSKGAKLLAGNFTSEMVPYHHCDRVGCYFGIGNANSLVDAIKNDATMKVRVSQFRGKPVDLNVPLNGFAEARSMMVDLAKQKAKSPAAAPAPAPAAPDSGSTP